MQTGSLKSPVTGEIMEAVTLEEGLSAFRCKTTGGHYIPAGFYMQWLEKQPARLDHLPAPSEPVAEAADSSQVLICPESGTLMTRYKVGHGFAFAIDRSITGGIWLDGGEWEALRQRNFHDEIHLVFTAPWQKQVRNEKAQAAYEETLRSALGADLFERLRTIRFELASHPHRNLALAFLTERNPIA